MKSIDNYLDYLQELEPISMAVIGGLEAASLLMTAFKMYKSSFTKAARKCADLTPKEKSLCMLKAKTLARNVEVQNLKVGLAKCAKARNPEKCKLKIGNKLKAVANDIKNLNARYTELKNKPEGT